MTEEDMPEWKKRLQRMDAAVKNKKEDGKQRCEKCQKIFGKHTSTKRSYGGNTQKTRKDINKDKLCYKCHQIEEFKSNPSKTKDWYNNKRRLGR